MFFPFLPLIMALGSSVLLIAPADVSIGHLPPVEAGELFILLTALLILTVRKFGTSFPLYPTLSRFILWSGWFGLNYLSDTGFQLANFMDNYTMGSPVTMIFLIFEYWLADGILVAFSFPGRSRQAIQNTFIRHLRLQMPILVISLLQSGWFTIMEMLTGDTASLSNYILQGLSAIMMLIVTSPFITIVCWGARPLKIPLFHEFLQHEIQKNHVSVANVMIWPAGIINSITAGVIGIVPGCRYLLISEVLIHTLSLEELRAVVAHEAGHLRHRHLFYFILAFSFVIEVMTVLMLLLSS
ncbi:MAG: M48 family metalloprotease, partial [SAR324 cluster bacterium]|nr:M48 family metalloprotease [SAR324 cluster bacterium]